MRRILFCFLLAIPFLAVAQQKLSAKDQAYVDSLVSRTKMIRQSKSHNMMVSFSEGTAEGLEPFFLYLINYKDYRTAKGKEVDVIETKTGYVAKFHKISDGYQQRELPLTVTINCIGNSDKLKSAVITGPLNLLIDIYLDYFEGHVKNDRPTKGGLDKTYTVTDEVRLYENRITVQAHNNHFGGD